jgi:O-antigen ligase
VGAVGFTLAVLGLLVRPLITFVRQPESDVAGRALLFALFVFGTLHNVLETDFLENDSPVWVTFLTMLALLRLPAEKHQ